MLLERTKTGIVFTNYPVEVFFDGFDIVLDRSES